MSDGHAGRPINRWRMALVLGCALTATACSNSGEEGATGDHDTATLTDCADAEPGSWTDLTAQADGFDTAALATRWGDEQGCALRLDVVFHTNSSDHCDWERAETISFGVPAGTPFTGPDADPPGQDWEPLYFFNTDGVVESQPPGRVVSISELPDDAVDIGARSTDGKRLLLAADEETLFEVDGDLARAFVRTADEDVSCA